MGLVFEFNDLYLWVVVSALLYYLFVHKSRRDKLLAVFPGPPRPPFIGHTFDFLLAKKEDLFPMMVKWCEQYGPVVKTFSGSRRFLMTNDPKFIEKVVTSSVHITKGPDYDFMRPWLGDGILMSDGQKWFHRRKMLTPAFHFKILEDFLPIMDTESRKMVKILREQHGGGSSFDAGPYITRCTLDIICETAMGIPLNAQEGENQEYSHAIRGFAEVMQNRAFRPWLHSDFMWQRSCYYKEEQEYLRILHGFTDNVIRERKQTRKSKKGAKGNDDKAPQDQDSIYFGKAKKKNAFLDLLLDVQEEVGDVELTDQNVREETDTIMFAGHDTTSVAATYAFFALGAYPEIQAKVIEELDSIFGDDKERPVTSEDITKMKYLDCVIKEALRVYPSVPFIQRHLSSDLKIDDDMTIPGDVTVAMFIYGAHHNPKYHPQPEVFKPERWESSDTKGKHPYAFIPFSAGPRNCIGQKFAGMEEKVIIANVLRNFEITSLKHPKNLQVIGEITLRSPEGVHIRLTPR